MPALPEHDLYFECMLAKTNCASITKMKPHKLTYVNKAKCCLFKRFWVFTYFGHKLS